MKTAWIALSIGNYWSSSCCKVVFYLKLKRSLVHFDLFLASLLWEFHNFSTSHVPSETKDAAAHGLPQNAVVRNAKENNALNQLLQRKSQMGNQPQGGENFFQHGMEGSLTK